MIIYNSTDTDHGILVLRWLAEMHASGEISNILARDAHSPQGFLRLFEPGRSKLFFEADEQGIWLAIWLTPCLDGAFLSLWAAPRKRRTRQLYASVVWMYKQALQWWPVLMGLTKQARHISLHYKLGYVIVGRIPYIWDGEDAYLVRLTKETFCGDRVLSARRQIAQHVSE